MNKDLERIQRRSETILGDYPEKRAALVTNLRAAEEGLARAISDQEAAEDMESYDRAQETVKRAELGVKFAKNALKKLEGAPRMDEAEYMRALSICQGIMDKATGEYREKAAGLMGQLKAVTDEYKQIAEETNSTLEKLDAAANVLQSKYTSRESKRQGAPSVFIPDGNVWKQHALRYDQGTAYAMATESLPEEREQPHKIHDSVLCAAWEAVRKAFPRTIF